jgi:serine/threonine protein kinase
MVISMGVIDPGETIKTVLPEQFGKYSLIGHLATGGMAEVWLARQVGLQGFEKIVVIKRARPELTDRDTTRRFLDEARLVATLEHPNIAQVYEMGSVSGSYFFVMEYVDGADLRRLMETAIARRQRISLADALYIMIHVCTGLHYAHDKRDLDGHPLQIIHRDVSPSNVLISHDGAVKVCDFGVAKAHYREGEITQDGVVKGKFSYMSPEQCQGKSIDRRSDVFSIGVLLYELTTLSKLFRARSDYALLQLVVEGRIPPPSSRVAGYPAELERIVFKALARDPSERYQTAQALQLDLEEFAREHKLAMSSTRITALMSSMIERRSDMRIRARGSRSDALVGVDAPSGSGNRPAFLADGSAPPAPRADAGTDPSSSGSQRSGNLATGVSSVTGSAPSHRSALWLVGAVLAGGVAAAATVADQMIVRAEDRTATSAIAGDVERIAALFDGAARSAHMRADGIATTPMLRAAIETDAATLGDLATSEMVFTAGKGESLEVFQFSGDRSSSLLRIPRTAASLQPLKGRATQIRSDARTLTLLASAPISGYRSGLSGGIVISTPIDLTPIQRVLAEHCAAASLTGLGGELVLVDSGGSVAASPVKLAVPSNGEWAAGPTALVATPKPSTGLAWTRPTRYMAGGLSALLLIGFIASLVRRVRE